MTSLCRFIFVILLSLTFFSLRAQEYIFNKVTMQEGLLSNNILSLLQDKEGYLWIGTANGLQRYDGYSFRSGTSSDTRKQVDQILEDRNGNMWIRMGREVGIFDRLYFTYKPIALPADMLKKNVVLRTDAAGNLFLLQPGGKCFYFDRQLNSFTGSTPFVIPDSLGIYEIIDDQLTDRYWLNTTSGLAVVDKKKQSFHASFHNGYGYPLINTNRFSSGVSRFFIDTRRRYWIQQWNTKKNDFDFYCYDEKRDVFTSDTTGLAAAGNGGYFDIYGFKSLRDSSIAVFGNNCLRISRNGSFSEVRDSIPNTYAIHFNTVNGLLEDKEHMLWVATDDGLYSSVSNLHATDHIILNQQNGQASVTALLQDAEERTWIGTWGRGVIVMNNDRGVDHSVNIYGGLTADKDLRLVWDMLRETKTGKCWIGCQSGKLIVYDPAVNKSVLLKPPAFGGSTVRQVVEDNRGNLWFGLQNGKLFKMAGPDNFTAITSFQGLISKLYVDQKGSLWVAVKGEGVFELEPASNQVIHSWKTVSYIKDILALNDSLYLLAAEELQLLHTNTGRVDTISQYENIPIGDVYALQNDGHGMVWLSTTNGIFRFNPFNATLIRYTQRDGLISIINNSYLMETAFRLKNGNLIFGGNEHLVVFNPAEYLVEAIPPDVTISSFRLFNNYLSPQSDKTVSFSFNENAFTIEFAALNFRQIEKLVYEYKMVGVDAEWTAVKIPRPVHYTLSPGKYSFTVRAKNSTGVYSRNTTILSFTVTPPFWRTWWFAAFIVVTTGGLLYYLYRLRVRRLLQLESVRSRLARDLHDDMGSTLSTINILSNMALKQQDAELSKSSPFLQKINHSATQMMQSMDDIVWSINPANDSALKLIARMKETAGTVLEPQQIEYQFNTDEIVKTMHFAMEDRRELFLVFKEAINNIVKYADCSSVSVDLSLRDGYFSLSITDNGKGFDAEMLKETVSTRGNGLKNMQKRAALLKGELAITSAYGEGTKVTLQFPVA